MISMCPNSRNLEIEVDKEGIKVYKIEKAPISKTEKRLQIDRKDWTNGPVELDIRIKSIEPTFKNENETLESLILQVSDIGAAKEPEEEFWLDVEEELGIIKTGSEIKLNGNKPAKTNLIDFVSYLIEKGKLSKKDLPVSSGYKRYLINTEPTNKEGKEMSSAIEINDGIYLESKFSRNQIKDKIRELGKRFGIKKGM